MKGKKTMRPSLMIEDRATIMESREYYGRSKKVPHVQHYREILIELFPHVDIETIDDILAEEETDLEKLVDFLLPHRAQSSNKTKELSLQDQSLWPSLPKKPVEHITVEKIDQQNKEEAQKKLIIQNQNHSADNEDYEWVIQEVDENSSLEGSYMFETESEDWESLSIASESLYTVDSIDEQSLTNGSYVHILKQNIDKFPPPPNKNSTRSFTLPLIAEHKFQEGFEENEMPVEFQKVRDFGKAKKSRRGKSQWKPKVKGNKQTKGPIFVA